jgi:hypothetical protein
MLNSLDIPLFLSATLKDPFPCPAFSWEIYIDDSYFTYPEQTIHEIKRLNILRGTGIHLGKMLP